MTKLEFFGTTYKKTILFIILAELLSFFVFWFRTVYDLSTVLYLIIIGLIFAISLIDLRLGVLSALVELFIGSQGHLFDLTINNQVISIRMGIFVVVMLAWLIQLIRTKNYKFTFTLIKNHKELIWLGLVCLWAVIFAIIRKNNFSDIFLDFNAWLYFLYFFPFLSVFKDNKHLNQILQIFIASLTAIILKSLIFLFVFSHKLVIMKDFYTWGRDTRWGEFTLLGQDFFRIFSQAQIFILLGFFIIVGYLFFKGQLNYRVKKNQLLAIILFLLISVIILSLSRSFWVGLLLGLISLVTLAIFLTKEKFPRIFALILRLGFITVLSYSLILTIINIPLNGNQGFDSAGSSIKDRISISDNAVSSRWSQLPILAKEISKHPIIGSGWGTTITYQSQDPRILTSKNPAGWFTTYAFEWGYLDMLLKIGLVGVCVYLIMIFAIIKKFLLLYKKNSDPYIRGLILGCLLALLSLLIVHAFSPYLNHPLGIGFILFLLALYPLLQPKIASAKL